MDGHSKSFEKMIIMAKTISPNRNNSHWKQHALPNHSDNIGSYGLQQSNAVYNNPFV